MEAALNRDIEVEERSIEPVEAAEAVRHGDGCLLLLNGKPFMVDEKTAVRLAWDLCVMFQESKPQDKETVDFVA